MNSIRHRHPLRLIAIAWIAALMLSPFAAHSADSTDRGPMDLESIAVLDLETAVRIALEGNPTLDIAKARVEQARQAIEQSKSAYWPRLDASASGFRVALSNTALASQRQLFQAIYGAGAAVDDPEMVYSAGLTGSWVLFDGFARKFNLAAAKHGLQSSEAAREDTRRLLVQAVTLSFSSAQLALESIAIAKADESFNQRLFTEAKLRYDVGTGALSDVLNFEVRANSTKSERITVERVYETERIGLAALLGIPQARLPRQMRLAELAPVSEAELEKPAADSLVEGAYALRPDLQQNEWLVRQAEADAAARRADYYPTISISAGINGERTDDVGFESDDFGNTVGLNLTYNLFAGGLTRAQVQAAKARLREVEKIRDSAKINVTSEVRNVVERVLSAQKQLLLQRANAALVRQNRDLVEKEYKAGVGSLVRLNEAQRDLISAQVSLAVSRSALRQAWFDLKSVTGQITQGFD
jgi:outer membrane protein TolC